MSVSPKRNPGDRTSTVVAAGLVLLGALGLGTIFSGPIMALVSPPPAETPTGEPASAQTPQASKDAGAATSGSSTTLGLGDGGGHS